MSRSRTALALAGAIALGGGLVAATSSGAQAACDLASAGNNIKHVVHITFDNVHLRRDNPNIPSDLEQMPNLLDFIQHNGTISGNHHTPLISHTATDILTALTGSYGDRMGVPVANSYGIFTPSGIKFSSSFLYWTSLSNGTAANGDGLPQMLDDRGKTHPAPWVPFTRAGCDVGAFSVANIEFESVPADVATVFGPTSSQVQAINAVLAANPNDNNFAHQKARQSVNTDWLGIAVHCAQGSPLCGGPNGGPDALPDEPVGLHRVQRAVRQHQCGAGDLRDRGQSGSLRRARPDRSRQGRVRRDRHRRRFWASGLPQHLQPDGVAGARLCGGNDGGRRAGHLRLCRRRA